MQCGMRAGRDVKKYAKSEVYIKSKHSGLYTIIPPLKSILNLLTKFDVRYSLIFQYYLQD